MKTALLGYGKMGHAIEQAALSRGHEIACTIDNYTEWELKADAFASCDVAIDFSQPSVALENISRCRLFNKPLVEGTTGWYDHIDEVVRLNNAMHARLFVASNFSVGMNIMFALNKRLAELMKGRGEYSVAIDETHHVHKLDAPSGTALTLARQIESSLDRPAGSLPIESHRVGEVPGTHVVRYHSEADTLTLAHEAHSRQGFALGAVLAAEFLTHQAPGYYTMDDLLGL